MLKADTYCSQLLIYITSTLSEVSKHDLPHIIWPPSILPRALEQQKHHTGHIAQQYSRQNMPLLSQFLDSAKLKFPGHEKVVEDSS
jgi:hypothetical protein